MYIRPGIQLLYTVQINSITDENYVEKDMKSNQLQLNIFTPQQ